MFKQMHWRLLTVIATFAIYSYAKDTDTLTVIASGETHAMLLPCDCPVEPGGGLAKRAHAIKSLTKGNTLLLDAGGFGGGGLYDSYTEGRAVDSLRTLAAIHAMAAMHYDAAAVGDDDLQFGAHWLVRAASAAGLPLVSANCLSADSSSLAAPYIIVKKGARTYAVTGLTTQEKLFTFPEPVVIRPPLAALRKIWPDMKKKADFLIVLSHLGEEMTRQVADSFPECDIIVNGHRKNTTQSAAYVGRSLFMQFGFAGKNLSRAALVPGKGGLSLVKTDWIPITPEVPDDPEIAKLIDLSIIPPALAALAASPKRETVLDLYIMSRCPYGLQALKELTDALPLFPKVEWAVHFIGSLEADSSLSSLHGNGEVRDEMLWLAVQALYPEHWVEFLRARAAVSETTSTEIIIKKLGLNSAGLKAWALTNGRQELLMHYNRSMRLGVQASPTLLANNSSVDMEITKPRLGKMLCSQSPVSSAYCDSIPECFDHRDCKKKGKVGTCVQNGGRAHCEYKEAVRFTFTVLMPDSMISHPEIEIINTTRDLFEGAVIETVAARSDAGRKLLSDFGPRALPYYFFDKKVLAADNFPQIEQGVEPKNDKFVFKEGYIKKAYFYNRPIIPGTCDVYIDPMFPGVKDAISAVLHYRGSVRLRVHPLLSISPDIDSISSGDRLGREEAQRWLLFSAHYPDKYSSYLESYLKRKDASYWFLSLGDLKIKTDDFVARIKANNGGMRDLWKTMTELGLSGPVELVVGNREVVRVKSQKGLGELLALMGK